MKEIYELKDMLCEELKEYGKKGELTAGSLDVVDKLTHTIKNINKIIEKCEEEEYSGNYMYDGGPYEHGGNRGGSYEPYDGGRSYARRGRGANARRDSMGRYAREGGGYSRHDNMIEELKYLMNDAPDDRTRMEIQKLVQKMEQM